MPSPQQKILRLHFATHLEHGKSYRLAHKQRHLYKKWHSVSPKYGWALRPRLKSRNILYMGPCVGGFRVSFVLGDRAVEAPASDLPKSILQEIAGSKRYAEEREFGCS